MTQSFFRFWNLVLLLLTAAASAGERPVPDTTVLGWKAQFASNAGPHGRIHAMQVHDDGSGPALYVAGAFAEAGGKQVAHIARWDGVSWTALGTGLNAAVAAMAVHQGKLIAGGFFTEAGGVAAARIAQWDGSRWAPLGQGLTHVNPANNHVSDLQVVNGDLYVTGIFDRAGGQPAPGVARWDGQTWAPLAAPPLQVWTLTEFQGQLVGASTFNVLRWDGHGWEALGGMVNRVSSLGVYRDELYKVGSFPGKVARWTGTAWVTVPNDFGADAQVDSMLADGDDLLVFGQLTQGSPFRSSVARWDGQSWSTLPAGVEDLWPGHLAFFEDKLLVAGSPMNTNVALLAWDGGRWSRLGSGLHGKVGPLLSDNGDLIAGGRFVVETPEPIRNLARWTDQGWIGYGEGPEGTVRAMLRFNGSLYLAGSFEWQRKNYGIARWDGAAWTYRVENANFSQILVHNGALIALGLQVDPATWQATHAFRLSGANWMPMSQGLDREPVGAGVMAGQLLAVHPAATMRWNGSSWVTAPELSVPWIANTAALHDGRLIVGAGQGSFQIHGWNGTSMAPLGEVQRGNLTSIHSHAGSLHITGNFRTPDGEVAPGVLRWTGNQWEPVGVGMNGGGQLASHAGELLIGRGTSGSLPFPGLPIAAHGLAETTTLEIVDVQPQPAEMGTPVRIRVRISGLTAPTAGLISVTGAPGGACSTSAMAPVSATASEAECAIRWTAPGVREVIAQYIGGGTRSRTWQPSTSSARALWITPPDRIHESGFESGADLGLQTP